MTFVTEFLDANRDRLRLERYGVRNGLGALVLTPRFESSRHAVFLVVPDGAATATLVAKVPRFVGDNAVLAREAAVLKAAQGSRPGGYRTIPRVVAFEEHEGRAVLVVTLLGGGPMDQRIVSRNRSRCVEEVVRWLLDLPCVPAAEDPTWYDRLIVQPLRAFAARFSPKAEEAELAWRTLEDLSPLAAAPIPLVLEHGDLADPNILWDRAKIGVVDWELANERGLPAHDLFFFLTYAACARIKTDSGELLIGAFERSFVDDDAWARPVINRYARTLGVSPELLRPLFIACWARYTARLIERVAPRPITPQRHGSPPYLGSGLRRWLRETRNYRLWRHTMEGISDPQWLLH